MTLAVVVAWRGRTELERCVRSLLDSTERVGAQIVVVNFGGNKRECVRLLPRHHRRVQVEHVSGHKFFSKPCALNIGAAMTKADVLFFSDCDILYEARMITRMYRTILGASDLFCTVKNVRETKREGSRKPGLIKVFGYNLFIRLRNGRTHWIDDSEEDAATGGRAAPGLLMVRKSHFLKIGGYNSHLTGWGFEDQDIISRLVLMLGLRRMTLGSAQHISHSVESRTRFYRDADQWASRDRAFRQALQNYNSGLFSGTYKVDLHSARSGSGRSVPGRS
ncbi:MULTISPECIES: galactosyltransferase-related protein [unclassified Bradyrhizobium]